jgi:putative phosphoribosyl transferase
VHGADRRRRHRNRIDRRAACQVARAQGAARVILAVPVAPPSTIHTLRDVADEVISLECPEQFLAIGQFYDDFTATSDDEVVRLLGLQ